MGRERGIRWATALVALSLLTACSPSVDPDADPTRDPFAGPVVPSAQSGQGSGAGQDGGQESGQGSADVPRPRTGRGVVTAVVPQGSALPETALRSFRATTGFTLHQIEVPAEDLGQAAPEGTTADVVIGLDADVALEAAAGGRLASTAPQDTATPEGTSLSGAPAASAYAHDDVCVLADREWFSANRLPLPSTLADLVDGKWATSLLIPDPAGSVDGRAFTRAAQAGLGAGVDAWWSALVTGGVHVGERDEVRKLWTASAGAPKDARPLLVAPESLAAHTLNDTGTETLAAAVPGTCVDRPLYAAITAAPSNADGAESVVAWLRGPVAQHDLAEGGIARPLDKGAAEDTVIGWSRPLTTGALSLPESEVASSRERAEAWSRSARAHR